MLLIKFPLKIYSRDGQTDGNNFANEDGIRKREKRRKTRVNGKKKLGFHIVETALIAERCDLRAET